MFRTIQLSNNVMFSSDKKFTTWGASSTIPTTMPHAFPTVKESTRLPIFEKLFPSSGISDSFGEDEEERIADLIFYNLFGADFTADNKESSIQSENTAATEENSSSGCSSLSVSLVETEPLLGGETEPLLGEETEPLLGGETALAVIGQEKALALLVLEDSTVEKPQPTEMSTDRRRNPSGGCGFCQNKGHPGWKTHTKYNCSELRKMAPCAICGAAGADNHTATYCPAKAICELTFIPPAQRQRRKGEEKIYKELHITMF